MRRGARLVGTFCAGAALVLTGAVVAPVAWAEEEMHPLCAPDAELPAPGETVGTVFAVTNPVDDGSPGTLSWAVEQSDTNPGMDTVEIPEGMTVELQEEIWIEEGLLLRAAGNELRPRATLKMGESVRGIQVGGDELYPPMMIDGLAFEGNPLNTYEAGVESNTDECKLIIRDSSFSGFTAAAVHIGADNSTFRMHVQRSHFFGNGLSPDEYEGALTMTGEGTHGTYVIEDSTFVDNLKGGVTFAEEYSLAPTNTITIRRSLFERNGPGNAEIFGGAFFVDSFYLDSDAQLDEPVIKIVDSVFRDNIGQQAGAVSIGRAELDSDSENIVVPEIIVITGSSFINNSQESGTEEVLAPLARDVSLGDLAEYDREFSPLIGSALRLENSTFMSSGEGASAALPTLAVAAGAGRIDISHTTMVGGSLRLDTGTDPQREISLRNSLVSNGEAEPVELVSDGHPWRTLTADSLVTEDHMAYSAAPAGVPEGPGRQVRALADYGLDALAERPAASGVTLPVMTPQPESPLINAAGASELTVDQLGAPRPQGPASDIGAIEAPFVAGQVALLEDVTVGEGEAAVFTVTRSAGTDGEASVRVSTADGTAVAGEDYTATSEVVTWADGEEGPKTVSVPTLSDSVEEADETFTVSLSEPSPGLTLGEPVTVTGTIQDRTEPGTDADADGAGDADAADGVDADAVDAADASDGTDVAGASDVADGTDATDGGGKTPGGSGKDPLAETGSGGFAGGLFLAGGLVLGGLALAWRRRPNIDG